MEEVYIGMLGLTTSLPIYDANQNRIKKNVVKILNAQGNKLGPSLKNFHQYTTLVELCLMSNELTDVHLETLQVSCTLRTLNLSNNDLQECPLLVENGLKNVTKVILQGNPNLDIDTCVQNLCGLRKLKHLDLSHTQIETIPDEIRKLQTLEELNISDTKILESELPIGIFSLKNLKKLVTDEAFGNYEGNQLEDLFEEQILERTEIHPTDKGEIFWKYSRGHALKLMKKVKKLEVKKEWPKKGSEVLQLWMNSSMLGSLGDDGLKDLFNNMRNVHSFKQITLLSLCTNDLYQIPTLRHFDSLRQLGLCRNHLKTIPAHVLSLPNLTHLYITDNKIERLVFNPEDLPALQELHLHGNPICRDYNAASECLESRANLRHPNCAVQGLKEVMLQECDLPREVEDDVEDDESGEESPMQPGPGMYPDGCYPNQPHPHTGYPGHGQPATATPPMQRHGRLPPGGALHQSPQMSRQGQLSSQGLSEDAEFEVLDRATVEDINGDTEKNLRTKIETSQAWVAIADELELSRDEKDLLKNDARKDEDKTLLWLLLKSWGHKDYSVGKLYRLLIRKGFKAAARILKDGVIDTLRDKGELRKILDKLAPQQAPAPQPGYQGYQPRYPHPGPPMYEDAGYPSYIGQRPVQPRYPPPRQEYHTPPPSFQSFTTQAQDPRFHCSPPPSYSVCDNNPSTRIHSQPESASILPVDQKIPDFRSLTLTDESVFTMTQTNRGNQNSIDFFGKRPSEGSIVYPPVEMIQGPPNSQYHRLSVDSNACYSSETSMKRVESWPESLQRSDSPGNQGYVQPAPGQGQAQFVPGQNQSQFVFGQSQSQFAPGQSHPQIAPGQSQSQFVSGQSHPQIAARYTQSQVVPACIQSLTTNIHGQSGPVSSQAQLRQGHVQSSVGSTPMSFQSNTGYINAPPVQSYRVMDHYPVQTLPTRQTPEDPMSKLGYVSATGPRPPTAVHSVPRNVPEESRSVPCQSDDPSVPHPEPPSNHSSSVVTQQASSYSISGNPTARDSQEPLSMTDEAHYRKVLLSAQSVETEPPGVTDEAILRKELNLHGEQR